MIIPNKYSGYQAGIRLYPGGGGGDGGGSGDSGDGGTGAAVGAQGSGEAGMGAAGTGNGTAAGGGGSDGSYGGGFDGSYGGGGGGTSYTNPVNTRGNTGTNPFQANQPPRGVDQRGLDLISSQAGTPYGQAGGAYNSLLGMGFSDNQIRNSITDIFGRPADSEYNALVQNAGMTSPTGRPMAGSAQFYQPVYQSQYMNYARPATQFDVSSYGTQPSGPSPASNSGMSRSDINRKLDSFYNTNYRNNPQGASINDTLSFMREQGISRPDIQSWGGVNNYGPQMSMPQAQQPFNPYTAGYGQQMQSPFSFQQPAQQTSIFGGQMQGGGYGQYGTNNPFSPYSNSFLNIDQNINQRPVQEQANAYRNAIQGGFNDQQIMNQVTGLFGRQNPTDMDFLRRQAFPTQQQYNPYQMQSPFSFQPQFQQQMRSPFSFQPQQNQFSRGNFIPDAPLPEGMMGTMGGSGYDPTTGRVDLGTAGGSGRYVSQPAAPRSSGPSRPIISRSAGMRGTPNVMRRAQGGITNLLGKK